MLQRVVCCGTGTAANIGRPVAGKTGTAQDYTNVYFAGYTPQVSTAVWVGFPNGQIPMDTYYGGSVFGGTVAAPIWHDFMVKAMAGLPRRGLRGAAGAGDADRSPTSSACRSRRPRRKLAQANFTPIARGRAVVRASRHRADAGSGRRRPAPARERGDAPRERRQGRAGRRAPPDGSHRGPGHPRAGEAGAGRRRRTRAGRRRAPGRDRRRPGPDRRRLEARRRRRDGHDLRRHVRGRRERRTAGTDGGNGNGGNGNGGGDDDGGEASQAMRARLAPATAA